MLHFSPVRSEGDRKMDGSSGVKIEKAIVWYFYTKPPNIKGKAYLQRQQVIDIELYGSTICRELSPDGNHTRFESNCERALPKSGQEIFVVASEDAEKKNQIWALAWALAP